METPEKKEFRPEEITFKPTINKNSEKMMKKYQISSQNRWELLYEQGVDKKRKNEYARQLCQKNEIDDKECTFKPAIASCGKNEEDLITRTYNWLKVKNERINLKVEADFDKDLRECTFSPNIIEFKNENKEPIEEIKGIKQFLDRQTAAKRTYSSKKLDTKERRQKVRELTPKEFSNAVKGLSNYLHSIDL